MTVIMMIFDFATFFIIIVFLNMLIAIMADTFAQAMENYKKNALQTKIQIVCEQAALIEMNHAERQVAEKNEKDINKIGVFKDSEILST